MPKPKSVANLAPPIPQTELNPKSEPLARIEVVGKQYEVEKEVAESSKGAAVFFVPSLLTPMFIPSEAVIHDPISGLFKLKLGYEQAIPDGLILQEKLNNPEQLATVLQRVISVEDMLKEGIKIIVFYKDIERAKTDNKVGFVERSNIDVLVKKYPNYLMLSKISEDKYKAHEKSICAATYCYQDNAIQKTVGVDASQINQANSQVEWGIKENNAAREKLENLNSFLNEKGFLPLRRIKEADDIHHIKKNVTRLPNWFFQLPTQEKVSDETPEPTEVYKASMQ